MSCRFARPPCAPAFWWLALPAALLAHLPAAAQAYRCPDPATGKVLYTDQPCPGGTEVAPRLSEQEQQYRAEAARNARERQALRQEQAALREQARQAAEQQQAQQRALNAPPAHESAECRAARAEADFRARTYSATDEQVRTARYNAALACGQQPPADIVVVQPAPAVVMPPPPMPYRQPYGGPYGYGVGGHLGGRHGGISFGYGNWQPAGPVPPPPRFGAPVRPLQPRSGMNQYLEPIAPNLTPGQR